MSLKVAVCSSPDVMRVSSTVSSYAVACPHRNCMRCPCILRDDSPNLRYTFRNLFSLYSLLVDAYSEEGILRWRARAAEEYREPAVVLKLLSSTSTASPIPHILKRSTAYSNTLTTLKTLQRTTAEPTMLRYRAPLRGPHGVLQAVRQTQADRPALPRRLRAHWNPRLLGQHRRHRHPGPHDDGQDGRLNSSGGTAEVLEAHPSS
jgi:hypothetical protein